MKLKNKILLFFWFVGFVVSCSGSPPGILKVDMSLLYTLEPLKGYQKSSILFSVAVDDKDGIGDIEKIIISSDDNGLYWEIKGDTWKNIQHEGMQWISFNILPPYGISIPAGKYKIIVRDYAGREDETSYTIKEHPRLFKKTAFPSIKLSDLNIQSLSDKAIMILGYSTEGRMIVSRTLDPGGSLAKDSFDTNIAYIFAVYEGEDYRLMTGPYYLF
ncbi:hypothetical protein WKV44_05565 [Spirochaetia bacterium 38H-sp]|uniref:Uncharacterized protein n=1 Tax=Rarispira pelagica TaxID=3141764 RepID=A0ABU9UBH7_9SPIR